MNWPIRTLRRAFVGASLTWFVALQLATLASSRPYLPIPVYLLSFGTYLVGSLLCHQRPERSFFLWGSQMPVCARCLGIYAGAALAAIALPFVARLKPSRLRSPATRASFGEARRSADGAEAARSTGVAPLHTREGGALRSARMLLIVSIVPAAATLVYEWTTGDVPANWIRALSGLPIGVVVAWIVMSAAPRAAEGMR
jgi:predicted membrane protein DUF2085